MLENHNLTFLTQVSSQLGGMGANGEVISDVTTSNAAIFSEGRSGSSCSGYRQKIANGENATTAFDGHKAKLKQGKASFSIRWAAPIGYRSLEAANGTHALVGTFSDPALLSITVADNVAKQKVLNDVMNRRTAFQGGIWLAEIDDTIRGIRHPLKALRDGLTAYHARSKKIAHKTGRAGLQSALTGSWLEFQFGMLQNVRDVESALENLKKMSNPRAMKFKASGKDEIKTFPAPQFTFPTPGMSSYIINKMKKTTTVTVTYRGAYKVKPPSGWDFESWGLSTQDFIPSIWEAIPYSFVVDYFSNIGRILQGYAYLRADIAWIAKTIRKEVFYNQYGVGLYVFPRSYPTTSVSLGSLGSTELTLSSVSRATSSVANLIQSLEFKVPGVGSLKWLNLAALVRLKTL